ncbi:MAG: hypothetical protein K0U45_10410 [Alphaproteobacteria bacterium]|nr:hypothetical protein [Alphaproteobacteria bacterium]
MKPIMILKRALQIYAIVLLFLVIPFLIERFYNGDYSDDYILLESLYFWVIHFGNWLDRNYDSNIAEIYIVILLIIWVGFLLSAIYDISKHYGLFAQNETIYIKKLKFFYQKAIVELNPNVYRFIIAISLLALVVKFY